MNPCDTDTLTAALIRLCRAHRSYANSLLGAFGLHAGQERLLLLIADAGGLNLSQLAASLGVQPPTVTRIVQRMEAGGLLERRSDPSDARASLICASAEGLALRERIEAVWAQLEARLGEGMTLEERLLLRRLLLQGGDNFTRP